MKVSHLKHLLSTISLTLLLISCGGNNTSRGTGWDINSKKGGFQYNVDFDEQETGPGLVFVEGGTFTKGQVQDDVMHDWNNTPNKQHVMSFYIDQTEVTNLMYLEYLNWLETVYPPIEDNRYLQVYQGALPDTLVWRNQLGYVEELTANYLRHPAYAEYPVVGVNWLQAVQYAEWRTDRVNEFILERESFVQKDAAFKQYSIEGVVKKLSKKRTAAVLDIGMQAGLEKGMKIDFYHFDFLHHYLSSQIQFHLVLLKKTLGLNPMCLYLQ